MSLVKTDYGLVYNTDGSLCYTERTDDVPFQGVKSYAIEESTENLLRSNVANFEDINWGSSSIVSREIIEGGGYNGRNAVKIVMGDNRINFQIVDADVRTKILNNIQVGDRISYQIKYKIIDPGSGGTFNFRTWGFSTAYPINDIDIGNGWKLRYGTGPQWTESSTITGACGISELPANSIILFSDFQVEIKNYSSSFVDGSRPDGIMYIPAENLDTKDYTLEDGSRVKLFNNHVVSLWFKVPKVQQNEINPSAGPWQPIQQIIGNYYSLLTGSHRYRQWGVIVYKRDGNLTFSAPFLGTTLGGGGRVISIVGNYEDEWHNLVLIFDVLTESSTEIIRNHKVYYDNNLISNTNYNLYLNTGVYGNSFINDNLYFNETSAMRSNLVSNIFVGKHRRPDGTVIWTDDYIKEVYEAKKPFNTNL
jgi:hypothetical protein